MQDQVGRSRKKKQEKLVVPGYSLNLGVMCALAARPITTSLSERPWPASHHKKTFN